MYTIPIYGRKSSTKEESERTELDVWHALADVDEKNLIY